MNFVNFEPFESQNPNKLFSSEAKETAGPSLPNQNSNNNTNNNKAAVWYNSRGSFLCNTGVIKIVV